MTKTLKALFASLFLALALLAAPAPAAADALDDAKAAGWLGERQDGYLGPVRAQIPPDVLALMNDINAKRRERYRAIAQKNGTSVEAVQTVAGQTVIQKMPAGQFYQDASGAWIQK